MCINKHIHADGQHEIPVSNTFNSEVSNFIDLDILTPPGFKTPVSKFFDNLISGIEKGIDPTDFIDADNPLEIIVPVLEMIVTSAISAIPYVGFILSGVLSVVFQWVNSAMHSKVYLNTLIQKIVNQSIDENNFRMMRLSVEGIQNLISDYISLLQPREFLSEVRNSYHPSPYDPTVAETIKEKIDSINTYIEGELPKFLIKGSEIHGLPLYAHIAALGGNLYVDFLKQRNLLGKVMSQQDFIRIFNEVEIQLFRHQQRLTEVIEDYIKAMNFRDKNDFVIKLYQFSSYGSFLNIIKKRKEALYGKNIKTRSSMELYNCGVSDDADYMASVISTNLLKRVSMMTSLQGYSHRGDYPLIQRLNQTFVLGDGDLVHDEQQSCTGIVGDGPDYETFIDSHFPTNEFANVPVGTGFSIPSKVAVWEYYSEGNSPGVVRAITMEDQNKKQYILGQALPLSGGGWCDHFSSTGYYLSGFITEQGGGSGFGGSCVADSGNVIGWQGVIFRHWSSLGQIPKIDEANGVELDLTCGFLSQQSATSVSLSRCYRDILIGKSVLFVNGGNTNTGIEFRLINIADTALECDVILTVSSPIFDPDSDSGDTEKNIIVSNETTGQKINASLKEVDMDNNLKYLQGQNKRKFLELIARQMKLTAGKNGNIIKFSMPDHAGFYFANALVIPVG